MLRLLERVGELKNDPKAPGKFCSASWLKVIYWATKACISDEFN